MERRVIAASVLACAWIVVGLAAPPTLAQSPPPPPQLTKIAPDRTSVGDLLTLTGANFQPPGGASQVTVHFGPIPIAVSPADDTSLSVTVPSGVQSGPVTVTTNALVNGLWVEQTSNSADILVIWADFHPSPTSPYGRYLTWADALLPGAADDLYAVTPHTDRWETAAIVHHISDQGQATTSDALYWPRSIGYGQSSLFWPVVSARNPADGQIYSLLVGTYNSPYYNPSHQTFEIRNVGTGSLALAAEIDQLTGTCPYTTFTISGQYCPVKSRIESAGYNG